MGSRGFLISVRDLCGYFTHFTHTCVEECLSADLNRRNSALVLLTAGLGDRCQQHEEVTGRDWTGLAHGDVGRSAFDFLQELIVECAFAKPFRDSQLDPAVVSYEPHVDDFDLANLAEIDDDPAGPATRVALG